MITNKQHTVLPFYTSLVQQWHRLYSNVSYKDIKIITPKNRLIPWEIVRPPFPGKLTSIKLVCMADETIKAELFDDIDTTDIVYHTSKGNDYIQYLGLKDLQYNIACGWYYLEATDGMKTWYSEVFVVMDFEDSTDRALSYNGQDAITYDNNNVLSYTD